MTKIPENFESGQSIGKIKSEKCIIEAMVQSVEFDARALNQDFLFSVCLSFEN